MKIETSWGRAEPSSESLSKLELFLFRHNLFDTICWFHLLHALQYIVRTSSFFNPFFILRVCFCSFSCSDIVNLLNYLYFSGNFIFDAIFIWRSSSFWGCLHFWGCLPFWGRLHLWHPLNFWGRLHFWGHANFLGCSYVWGSLNFYF